MKLITQIGLLFFIQQVSSQATGCDPTIPDVVGPQVQQRDKFESGNQDFAAFLAISQVVQCHGVIMEWNLYYPGLNFSLACHNLRLQVWRPVSGDTYQLVGENLWDFSNEFGCADGLEPEEGQYNFTVPVAMRIPVQDGDVIGWVDDGFFDEARIIKFDEDLSGSNQYGTVRALLTGTACVTSTVGDTCNWAEQGLGGSAFHLVRDYSLQAKLDETNDPVIINVPPPADVSVKEHQPAGIFVYTVIGNNRWTSSVTVPPPLLYTVTGGNGTGFFDIDPDTGVITTTAELDYEVLIPPDNPTYNLDITVSDGPKSSLPVTLTITVVDVNEPHVLDGLPARVDHNATSAILDVATAKNIDPDTDPLDIWPLKTYFMMPSDPSVNVFTITDVENPAGSRVIEGKITITESLTDWLGHDRVELYVYCTDGTFTAGPHVIEVVITNLREPPILTDVPFLKSLTEDSAVSTSVHDVNGKVPNRGDWLSYSINKQYPRAPSAEHKFSIQDRSGLGEVRTQDTFDFFTCNKYAVEVIGNDGYFDTDPQNVTVEITWVNEPPVFAFERNSVIKVTYKADILEKTTIGTALPGVILDASDRDIPIGDWIAYTILDDSGGSGAHLFTGNNITQRVYVSGEVIVPAKQDNRTINMLVHVRDRAAEYDETTLVVTVIDINDHAPVFSPKYYSGNVNETDKGETFILSMSADDQDGSQNNQITFVVLEPDAFLYFEVAANGDMTLKQPIKHHDFPNITFTVLAMDNGSPILNDTATVYIEVEDNNIHRPEFVSDFYNTEVRSDSPVGSVAITIEAVDLDLPSTSPVTYFLLKPDEDFRVQTSGDVLVKRGLKSGRLHLLYAYARDQGTPEEYFSDPCIVRLDTYSASSHLVDIHMQYPLEDFKLRHQDFIDKLNAELSPWVVKLESALLDGSPERSIARIYALVDNKADTVNDIDEEKSFVGKNSLLGRLRTDIPGNPRDWLRGPEFSEYQPVKVLPAYPVWLVDTVGGIVFLTFLCLLIVAVIIAIWLYLAKKYQWLCFKTKVAPVAAVPPKDPLPPVEEFELGYSNSPLKSKSRPSAPPLTNPPTRLPVMIVEPMDTPPAYPTDGLSTW